MEKAMLKIFFAVSRLITASAPWQPLLRNTPPAHYAGTAVNDRSVCLLGIDIIMNSHWVADSLDQR